MARTNEDSVGEIIEVDVNIDLTPFIDTANSLVEEIASSSGHDDARLELIERYLAAHFYTLRDPRPTSEKAGSVGVNYQSKVDLNLKTSHYGQTALVLDTSGLLAAINNRASRGKKTVSVHWLGQTDDQGL